MIDKYSVWCRVVPTTTRQEDTMNFDYEWFVIGIMAGATIFMMHIKGWF